MHLVISIECALFDSEDAQIVFTNCRPLVVKLQLRYAST